MAKLVTCKTVKPNNENCGGCGEAIDAPAVKCEQCKSFYHVPCTKQPVYTLIKYFTSRMQYVCEKCITSSVHHYDELVDWIKSFRTCETSDVTTGSGGVEVIHEGSNELSAVLEAVTEIRDKISFITSCNETPKLEKRLYADIVR